tara:strand:- start:297 stop:596 length:300 start_codon:yes stop_codon:yes gene_type:complete
MTSVDQEEYKLESLENYRNSIDRLDAILVFTLAERFKITEKVGKLKATVNLPASDPKRENRQLERLEKLSLEAGLDPIFAKEFLKFIISEVIRHHKKFK